MSAPVELQEAVAEFWCSEGFESQNLFRWPPFERFRERCRKIYSLGSEGSGLNIAVEYALRSLGVPCLQSSEHRQAAVSSTEAAEQLHRAFTATSVEHTYLCPLDLAGELPPLQFGPARVQRCSAAELELLFRSEALRRFFPSEHFDSSLFSHFRWLIVHQSTPLGLDPGARAFPFLNVTLDRQIGSIEPHSRKFPASVDDALFLLLLCAWEDSTDMPDFEWRPFFVPWFHVTSNDLFDRPAHCKSASSLTWTYDIYMKDGDEVLVEVPQRLNMDEARARDQSTWLNDVAWNNLQAAKVSPILAAPAVHFFVRAFHGEGVDEFLDHVVTIDAALGSHDDHRKRGATKRLKCRLANLLRDPQAGDDFGTLYQLRSEYIHGRSMYGVISAEHRLLARRLARRAMRALFELAVSSPALSREIFLDRLLTTP